MSQDLLALVVAALVFASELAGFAYNAWHPGTEGRATTRDLIDRLTALVATMSARVLGPLIASANAFYNTRKAGVQVVSAKVLELDGVLRCCGQWLVRAPSSNVRSGFSVARTASGCSPRRSLLDGAEFSVDTAATFADRPFNAVNVTNELGAVLAAGAEHLGDLSLVPGSIAHAVLVAMPSLDSL